jgi:hypothetical protein
MGHPLNNPDKPAGAAAVPSVQLQLGPDHLIDVADEQQ